MLHSIKTFWVLITIFFVLTITKISLDYFTRNDNDKSDVDYISPQEAEKIFLASLKNFDIPDSLIFSETQKKIKNYKVTSYSNLPIEVILLELERNFSGKNVSISTTDLMQEKGSICKIFLDNELIIKVEFNKREKFERNNGVICLLVKVNNPEDVTNKILESPEKFVFLIVPSKSLYNTIREIKNRNRTYYLYINDEIKDLIYKLGKNYPKLLLKNTLYYTLRDFNNSSKVVINNTENWIDSVGYNLIVRELKRNKIKFIESKHLIDLTDTGDSAFENFNNEVISINPPVSKFFIVNSEQFAEISKVFPSLRKSGYKIVGPETADSSITSK
jgi:hypothetical protein